ncbi:MAG: hypothetical protein QHH07_07915 [Sedimentisphaerales bacterium]|jgi:hypothetical protein|nr:hypothetical protein [Sedimentisphaerales bacterium]
MKQRPYKKRPGDLEIRILKDGRLVLVGPDQALLDLAKAVVDRSTGKDKGDNGGCQPATDNRG